MQGLEKDNKSHVLFIARASWYGAIDLVRYIKEAGGKTCAFATENSLIRKSRYLDEAYIGKEDERSFVEELKVYWNRYKDSIALVIIADEPTYDVLLTQKDQAWIRELLPIDCDIVDPEILSSKQAAAELFDTIALPQPKWRIMEDCNQVEQIIQDLSLPLYAKPIVGYGGNDTGKVETAEDLKELWNTKNSDGPFIVQELVPGKVAVVSAQYVHGRLISWSFSYKERVFPEPSGPSAARLYDDVPGLEKSLKNFGTVTKFHGFCGFDTFKLSGSPDHSFIEVNLRPVSCVNFQNKVGIDLVHICRTMLDDDGYFQKPPSYSQLNLPIIPFFPSDLCRQFEHESYLTIIKSILSPIYWLDIRFDEREILPHRFSRLKYAAQMRLWKDFKQIAPDFFIKTVREIFKKSS